MILVTGGAGYIGSVTVELLRKKGKSVVVLDNLSRGHRDAVAPEIPFYRGNIGDTDLVSEICSKHNIDSCIHFAAYAYVGESVQQPEIYFENNVEQSTRLLNALIKSGVKKIVFSSSCATYGEPQCIPIDETHRQQPTNPYGWSKLFVERIMESYDLAYGLKFVALRYFNAAGASATRGECHDPETHLLPNVLNTALGKLSAVSVFGSDYSTHDGTAVRDYIHVEDLASAHILALDHLRGGGASECINLGNGRGYSVLEVIKTARSVTEKNIEMKLESRRPGDPSHLVADASKAQKVLGWVPKYPELSAIINSDWKWRTKQ